MALTILWLGGNCPVQSEGYFDDHPYYFRSRGERWSLSIATPSSTHKDFQNFTVIATEYYGPWPSAGSMSVDEAYTIIILEYFKWKKKQAEQSLPVCL